MAFARLLFRTIVSLSKRWAATECELVLNAMTAGDKIVYNKLQPMIRFSFKDEAAWIPFTSGRHICSGSFLLDTFVKPQFAHIRETTFCSCVKLHFAHIRETTFCSYAWNYILLIFVKPQFAHICETKFCSHFVKLNFAHVCETKFCSYLWNYICSYLWNHNFAHICETKFCYYIQASPFEPLLRSLGVNGDCSDVYAQVFSYLKHYVVAFNTI